VRTGKWSRNMRTLPPKMTLDTTRKPFYAGPKRAAQTQSKVVSLIRPTINLYSRFCTRVLIESVVIDEKLGVPDGFEPVYRR